MLEEHDFQVVLSDFRMPSMEGGSLVNYSNIGNSELIMWKRFLCRKLGIHSWVKGRKVMHHDLDQNYENCEICNKERPVPQM